MQARSPSERIPLKRQRTPVANPFEDASVVRGYEQWYQGRGQAADRLEKRLLARLLSHYPRATTLLEVGCGTGHFTRWLAQQGFQAVGLDLSPLMLEEARRLNGLRYVQGDALALPFESGFFDVVAMITTLEFVADPQRALSEAVRVARQGLILGVLNRCSLLARRRKAAARSPWDVARFFTPGELARLVQQVAGERFRRPYWRTTLWPSPLGGSLPLPWGGFVGMRVDLEPRGTGQTTRL
jgi:SAM-dependent methyltransferase